MLRRSESDSPVKRASCSSNAPSHIYWIHISHGGSRWSKHRGMTCVLSQPCKWGAMTEANVLPIMPNAQPTILLNVVDQHGQTEELTGVRANQPLLEVALRLDSRFQMAQPPLQPGQQPPLQLPEVDLLSLDGESLPLLSLPSAFSLKDGSRIYCYRYGEVCREYRKNHMDGVGGGPAGAAAAAPRMDSSGKPIVVKPPPPAQYVGIYLSDWLCGYQRRVLLHHDLAVPFEELLRPYCAMRGMVTEEASFVWLQFYRKVGRSMGDACIGSSRTGHCRMVTVWLLQGVKRPGRELCHSLAPYQHRLPCGAPCPQVKLDDTGRGMDLEDGDCIYAYNSKVGRTVTTDLYQRAPILAFIPYRCSHCQSYRINQRIPITSFRISSLLHWLSLSPLTASPGAAVGCRLQRRHQPGGGGADGGGLAVCRALLYGGADGRALSSACSCGGEPRAPYQADGGEVGGTSGGHLGRKRHGPAGTLCTPLAISDRQHFS